MSVEQAEQEQDRLGYAIALLDQEMNAIAREHTSELVAEVIEDHEAAQHDVDRALAILEEAHDRARHAYTAAQAILTAAGDTERTRRLRVVPNAEQIIRERGLPDLLPDHADVRAAA